MDRVSEAQDRRDRIEDWLREGGPRSTQLEQDLWSLLGAIDGTVAASRDRTHPLHVTVRDALRRQRFDVDSVADASLSIIGRRLGGQR